MFKYKSIQDQFIEAQQKNRLLESDIMQLQANLDFVAMMSDIEIDNEEEEEAESNVEEIQESEELL
jgi:hypothetical protein